MIILRPFRIPCSTIKHCVQRNLLKAINLKAADWNNILRSIVYQKAECAREEEVLMLQIFWTTV